MTRWLATAVRAALRAAVCVFVVAATAYAADTDPVLERRVKAAFIYQFIPYVEWPAGATSEGAVVVAVAGSDATLAEFANVIGERRAADRPVVVRRWRDSDFGGGAHIVFVRESHAARLPAIARAAAQTGMLVVSESPGGLAQGSMINFELVDGRVRFDVSLTAAERAGLRISSRLLAVAREVRTQP